ncbi:MAG TPA: hypothetical protein VKX45_19270 [Bryobacteraceae bacterium]|nr:hypothetical protein [Bryobacteraceae bacterium]
MRQLIVLAMALCSALPVHPQALKTVTLTGWFSDERCAPARLKAAKLGPTNPDCSAECIRKGAAAVFLSESREILRVVDYPGVLDDLGFHVEVTGAFDPAAKTIRVSSVKQLSWDGAACSRPKKPAKRP